jgi:hypothetical protein
VAFSEVPKRWTPTTSAPIRAVHPCLVAGLGVGHPGHVVYPPPGGTGPAGHRHATRLPVEFGEPSRLDMEHRWKPGAAARTSVETLTAAGHYSFQTHVETQGPFVFQVNFVDAANASGARPLPSLKAAIRVELDRIEKRVDEEEWEVPSVYVLITNVPVSARGHHDLERRPRSTCWRRPPDWSAWGRDRARRSRRG